MSHTSHPHDPPVDVLVIGAGPSGAVVTHTLATQGFDVLCLEQGDWINPSEFPGNFPEWELLIQRQWAHDPNIRRLPADYPLEVSDSDLGPVMFNAVGEKTLYIFGTGNIITLPMVWALYPESNQCTLDEMGPLFAADRPWV